jgi:hypothetical protein
VLAGAHACCSHSRALQQPASKTAANWHEVITWADPEFERFFINGWGWGDKDQCLQGPLFGADGWGWTRDFATKNPVFAGKLSIQKF